MSVRLRFYGVKAVKIARGYISSHAGSPYLTREIVIEHDEGKFAITLDSLDGKVDLPVIDIDAETV
jgi:hypothetical protein